MQRDTAAVYQRLYRPLFNTVYRYVLNAADAHDLVQETFVRLCLHQARVDAACPDRWLFRTALNLARNRLRWRRVWRWIGDDAIDELPGTDDPAQQFSAAREQAQLDRAIAALPEKLRAVILLTDIAGQSYQDVAAILDIPPGTVASRRHLALQKLKRLAALPAENSGSGENVSPAPAINTGAEQESQS